MTEGVLGQIHYVDVLKHIHVMDYGKLIERIALMECKWVKHDVDDSGKPTYKRDESGFLLENFPTTLLCERWDASGEQ